MIWNCLLTVSGSLRKHLSDFRGWMSLGEIFFVTTTSVLPKLTSTISSVDIEAWAWSEGDNGWSSTVSCPVPLDEESHVWGSVPTSWLAWSHGLVWGVSAIEVLLEKTSFLYPAMPVGPNTDLGPSSSLSKPLGYSSSGSWEVFRGPISLHP